MSQGDALPDPILDDFDPIGELDYGEEDPDIPDQASVADPSQPSSSGHRRINSSDSLPGMADGTERSSNNSRHIGPALPPSFMIGCADDGAPDDPGEDDEPAAHNIGPAMPPGILLGPSLPDEEGAPPEPSGSRSIGPTLPPHLMNPNLDDEEEEDDDAVDLYGPAPPPMNGNGLIAPPEEDDSDDDAIIGPAPPPAGAVDVEQEAEEYALRRLAYEQEKEAQKNTTKREEWMLQLPKKLTNYGLGARTFSKGPGAEKDSSWTDAPGQKKRKVESDDPSSSIHAAAQKARDQEQDKLASKLNNSRQESLLDSHQKTRNQAAGNGFLAPGVRRPFDREKDMEVRGLKNVSSDEIKEKVGNLGSRFGSSTKQKYL